MGMAAQVDRHVTARPDSNAKGIQDGRSEPILFDSGAESALSGDATILNQTTATGPTVSTMRELLRLEFAPGPDVRVVPKQACGLAPAAIPLFDQSPFAGKQFWECVRMVVAGWRNRDRLRRQVASLSDRELWDVSLTRADVMNETHRPFWKP